MSIKYPGNWKVVENALGTIVAFMSPQDSASDTLSENVNIAAGTYTQKETLEEYRDGTTNGFPQLLEDYRQIEISEAKVNGYGGFKHVYTFKQRGITLKGAQYILYTKYFVYAVTFTATVDSYDTYLPTFEAMAKSFTSTRT
jgi:hypothetical protein